MSSTLRGSEAARLLATLRARGATVQAVGGDIVIDTLPGALDLALVEGLRSYKADVLALLAPVPAIAGATAMLAEVFRARQDAATAALAGASDGGAIAAYREAIGRWARYLDGLADQGVGRSRLEVAALGELRRLLDREGR